MSKLELMSVTTTDSWRAHHAPTSGSAARESERARRTGRASGWVCRLPFSHLSPLRQLPLPARDSLSSSIFRSCPQYIDSRHAEAVRPRLRVPSASPPGCRLPHCFPPFSSSLMFRNCQPTTHLQASRPSFTGGPLASCDEQTQDRDVKALYQHTFK